MTDKIHQGPIIDTLDGYNVIECETCCFRHVFPLPSQDDTDEMYRDKHYDDGVRDRLQYYERDHDWWMMNYGDIVAEIDRVRDTSKTPTLIDVGCGAGLFLECANSKGWNTVGVEISTIAADHCRDKGLTIINDAFSSKTKGLPVKVDIIHMRNILEHVPDPAALIKDAYELLAPGGIFVAGVPNDYNPLQEGLRKVEDYPPWWLAIPHHLNYFNFESLTALLDQCGFESCGRFASFPIDLFLAMGDNYVKTPEKGKQSHARRVQLEIFLEKAELQYLRQDLYRSFANIGLGREALIIARKK